MIQLKRFFEIVANLAQGLIYSRFLNQGRTHEEQINRGNSPNRFNLMLIRVALAAAPMLPAGRFAAAKGDISDSPESVYKEKIYNSFVWLILLNLSLTLGLEFLYRQLNHLAPDNVIKRHFFPLVKKVNGDLPTLFFYTNILIAVGAIYAGAWLLPASFLFFNVVNAIQRKNLYSDKVRDKIDNLLFLAAAFSGFIYGNYLEKLLFALDVIGRSSQILENATYYLIKLFKVPAGLVSSRLKQELNILADRLTPQKPLDFKFQASADNFHDLLKGLSISERLRVNKRYVQEARHTLPLVLDGVNSCDLLSVFKSEALQNEWPIYHEIIVKSIKDDWKLSEEDIDFSNPVECLDKLYDGLKIYITDVRAGALPGTVLGSTSRLNHYLDSVTDMIHKGMEAQEYDLLIRILIKLGIEGGNNCSVGKARALEEAHRMLINQNTDGIVPPEVRVANIFQQNREHYFQENISESWFIGCVPIFIFNWMYHEEDTHAYNIKVALSAPRLGLPSLSAQIDLDTQSGCGDFICTLTSFCEQRFWRQTTVQILQDEMQAAVMGSHQFKAQDVQRWYEDFLQRHLIGNEEEQADIASEFGEKAPTDLVDGQNVMRPDFLTLMLLDMGVLYLEGENQWGEFVVPLIQPDSEKIVWSVSNTLTYGFNVIRNLPSNVLELATDVLVVGNVRRP